MDAARRSLDSVTTSRVKKWIRRVHGSGALGLEILRLINKSSLARIVRKIVDMYHWTRRKGRILAHPLVATPQQKEMLEHLGRYGWAKVPDGLERNLRQGILDECLALREAYHELNVREKNRQKAIWNYLSDIKYGDKKPDQNNVLVRFALAPAILNVIADYLGEIPWLRYIILTESVFQPSDVQYSQKWHLDFDDARMLKLFMYLSDVELPDDGPFRLVNRKASLGIRNSFIRRHLKDSEVFRWISNDDVIDILGSRMSSFIVDTSQIYHCGSRLTAGRSRLLYTALYTAFPSIYPEACDAYSTKPKSSDLVRQVLTPYAHIQKAVS